jgi:hypothetical protein
MEKGSKETGMRMRERHCDRYLSQCVCEMMWSLTIESSSESAFMSRLCLAPETAAR